MERISRRQLVLLGAGYMFDATLISLPSQMIETAHQDAWMGYPIALVVVIGAMWLFIQTVKRFPEQNLLEALTERIPRLGRVIITLGMLFYFMIFVRDLRMVVDFINIALLPRTPLYVIGLLILLSIVPFVRSGIEVLARVNFLFFAVLVLAVLTIPLMTLKEFNPEEFKPVLEEGLIPGLKSAWLAFPYLGEVLVLPFLFSTRRLSFKTSVTACLLGTGLLLLLIVLNITVVGVEISSRFTYPNHELIRQIRLTDFLDRFDLIIVSIWLPAVICKIGLSLYILSSGIHQILPRVTRQLLVAPLGFLGLACSFAFFHNAIEPTHLTYVWPIVTLFYFVVVPALLYLFVHPKKKAMSK